MLTYPEILLLHLRGFILFLVKYWNAKSDTPNTLQVLVDLDLGLCSPDILLR